MRLKRRREKKRKVSRAAAGVAGLVAVLMVLAAAVLAANDPQPNRLKGSDPLSDIGSRGLTPPRLGLEAAHRPGIVTP